MGWQTQVAIQLQAGDTIINPSGAFTYSSAPATGNLIGSITPASGTDSFGNNYLQGISAYGATFASSLNGGFLTLYTGSLAAGWTARSLIEINPLGDILLTAAAGRSVITNNTTLDDGSGNMSCNNLSVSTINGSSNTGSGNNGGVTSGPSGTVNAFPAAGPNHTHAEVHQHPI